MMIYVLLVYVLQSQPPPGPTDATNPGPMLLANGSIFLSVQTASTSFREPPHACGSAPYHPTRAPRDMLRLVPVSVLCLCLCLCCDGVLCPCVLDADCLHFNRQTHDSPKHASPM